MEGWQKFKEFLTRWFKTSSITELKRFVNEKYSAKIKNIHFVIPKESKQSKILQLDKANVIKDKDTLR